MKTYEKGFFKNKFNSINHQTTIIIPSRHRLEIIFITFQKWNCQYLELGKIFLIFKFQI